MPARIEFRELVPADFPMLRAWFQDPEVVEWWAPPRDLPSIRAKYLPRLLGEEATSMWVIVIDGVNAGLAQSYRHVDHPAHDAVVGIADAAGIDYLLTVAFRGRGLAPDVLSALAAHALASHRGTTVCVATPSTANVKSCRALERAGFERRAEITGVGGFRETVYAMTPDRP